MGLNRLVTLFHGKLNSLGGATIKSDSSSTSGCDSSTTISLSSSIESLSAVAAVQHTTTSPPPVTIMPVVSVQYTENDCGASRDANNNNNSTNSAPVAVVSPRKVLNSLETKVSLARLQKNQCISDVNFVGQEEVLLVLGTPRTPTLLQGSRKRNTSLARRFSLKAKFSSDLDLYGKGGDVDSKANMIENRFLMRSSTASLLEKDTGQEVKQERKKSSLWSSFRLPIKLLKGKKGEHKESDWRGIILRTTGGRR